MHLGQDADSSEIAHDFTQSFHENAWIVDPTSNYTTITSTFFQSHYSLMILSFNDMESKLLMDGFPPRRPGFEPGSGHVGFVVDKVALGQVFSEYFGFPGKSSFHQLLHNHHHLSSGAGTIGQKWPQYLVDLVPPTNNNNKKIIIIIHTAQISTWRNLAYLASQSVQFFS
jgi:hypothetical protein